MDYRTPLDIANRACQLCGVEPIGLEGFNEDSKQANEIDFVYDKLRRAELRRNLWKCSIRHTVLRPVTHTTMRMRPLMWMSTQTYFVGSVCSTSDGVLWMSKVDNNLDRAPGYDSDAWEMYTGPVTADVYASTTSYFTGELVYTFPGDGTYKVYMSLTDTNTDNPATATAYDATVTYRKGIVVTSAAIQYQSLVSLNLGKTPASNPTQWSTAITNGTGSSKWLLLGAYLEDLIFAFPIGLGPDSNTDVRNVFALPANYLRKAGQDPKAGSTSSIGAPSNIAYNDWLYEGDYIISSDALIVFRFGADLADVSKMDPMFCEGLAARIGIAVCPSLTQSDGKLQAIETQYKLFISEARIVNGIEQGPQEPALDDWLACRV